MAISSSDVFGEIQLDEVVVQGSVDFEAWTTLVSKVEHIYRDDIDKVSMVYDSFLSEFPLCYGYWKKYAEHKARLCGVENVVQIFERAVESAPYSVGVWLDYCNFGVSSFEDTFDVCRLFDRALSLVGKDYHCYKLWDKYIEYEFSHQHWNSLANIYIQTLKFPTKKLHQYYESFKKLVAIWEEEMQCQGISCAKLQSGYEINGEIKALEDAEISSVISDLLDPSTRSKALLKYIYIGEQIYQRACELYRKVQKFEQNICRPYFHVKPLDDNQLHNWHRYLDLVEIEGDFDWAVNLYERCLISCANYPEFWMRYVDYVQSKGGREMATNALERATHTFLKNAPEIHLFNAWFKEETGDVDGVRAAFQQCDQDFESCLIDIVRRKANMERRLGNYLAASNIYKEALDIAAEKRPNTLPMLYLHFARLQFMITSNVEATLEVLLNGIQRVPHSKLLLKELIFFALMHEGAIEMETLDSIMAKALTPESDVSGSLSPKEREDISRLYLELIDFCGSIHDVRRAWKRHLKWFPHLLRVQPSLKKPAKAGTIWKMITDGTCLQNSMGKRGENHLTHLPPSEDKLLEEDNIDQSEQAIDGQAQFEGGNGSLNDSEMVPSGVTKTLTEDACCRGNELKGRAVHQAAADKSPLKVDSKSDGFQQDQEQEQEQEQKFQQLKRPSLDNPSLNPQGYEPPREASFSNRSIPASPRDTNVAERDNESPGSSMPIHTRGHSDREGNWRRLNPSGKGRSDVGSPGNSEERLERSLSPRRRSSHGYLDDRRHRERSLSPRRHSYHRHSEDRWHRERRNRRNFRYQDNSRGHRDNRMQNGNQVVVVGNNTVRTPNVQQQSTGFVPQTQLSVQPVAYSQGMNEQYGTGQNNQLYNQMWQYYYYNQQQQQQQVVQQQPPYQQQQVQQMQSHQQLQQQMQNPPQQIPAQQQQLLNLQYQQQMLYQQSQFQQQQTTNEQSESQDQQLQLQQQMQQQMQLPQQQLQQPQQQQQVQIQQLQPQQQVQIQQQQQPQVQQQEEVDLQKQQQQAYQYQQLQQQQYLLYLQQLQQYQHSQQQQPGVVKDQQSLQQQLQLPAKQERLENVRELQNRDDSSKSEPQQDDVSLQVDSRSSSHCQQGPEIECNRTSISCGVASLPQSQDQLPEIEGTEI